MKKAILAIMVLGLWLRTCNCAMAQGATGLQQLQLREEIEELTVPGHSRYSFE